MAEETEAYVRRKGEIVLWIQEPGLYGQAVSEVTEIESERSVVLPRKIVIAIMRAM